MNKFFSAIGFSEPMTSVRIEQLVNEVLVSPDYRAYTTNGEDTVLAEFRESFGPNFGVSVVGEFDSNDKFRYEYCYPYLISEDVSTSERLTVEPRIREESYAGVVDDAKVGVTLIFQVQNIIDYFKRFSSGGNQMAEERVTGCCLSALSVEGMILLPIEKNVSDVQKSKRWSDHRTNMIRSAMGGDDASMQKLTIEDMDLYSVVARHAETEDVYSLVDSYFMPFGVDCDMYNVMGIIRSFRLVKNKDTEEDLYQLLIDCNELFFWVQINSRNLMGEPLPGRRFKGVIWMQGMLKYADETKDEFGGVTGIL